MGANQVSSVLPKDSHVLTADMAGAHLEMALLIQMRSKLF